MKNPRRSAAAVAAAAVVVSGGGAGIARANAADAPVQVPASHLVRSTATVTAHGTVVDHEGAPVDDIDVEAYTLGSTARLVSSSITYGGAYDLDVPAGTYRLVLTDLDARYVSRTLPKVKVAGDLDLAPVTMLLPAAHAVTLPTVVGVARAGRVLQATPGTWDLPGTAIHYSWTADGTTVSSGPTFTPGAKQVGASVRAVVTATVPGHARAVVATQAVKVARYDARLAPVVKVGKDKRVTVSLRASSPGSLRGGKVQFAEVTNDSGHGVLAHSRAITVTGATWSGSWTTARARKGLHTYVVTYSGSATVAKASAQAQTRVR